MNRGSRRSRADASVSLFPFLAVLICTMGALIVLLVLTVQQAGNSNQGATQPPVQVVAPSPPPLPTVGDDELAALRETEEDLSWNFEMLQEARQKTLKRLQDQQALLSMAEGQSRDLKSQLERLRDEVELLKSALQDGLDDEENHTAQLAALQAEIASTESQLAATQRAAQQQSRAFALIPYEGASGTKRRPIFVECRADKITFQPEGITINFEDLTGPWGRNNALAAALRAVREYLLDTGITKTSGEAYPLLIVRPGGELAYAACRSALDGWDNEFGYELIPDNMKLAFPQTDPTLQNLISKTVSETIRRQARFAVLSKPQGRELSISSPAGGFVPTGPVEGDAWGGPASSGGPAALAARYGAAPAAQQGAAPRGPHDAASTAPNGGGPTASPSAARDSSFPTESANGQVPSDPEGNRADQPPSGDGAPTDPSSRQLPADDLAAAREAPGAADGAADGASPNLEQAPTDPSAAGNSFPQVSLSLAETRGANWALPTDTQGAIGVVRPVPLTCTKHELVLHPERQTGQQQATVPFVGTTTSTMQPLIATLWQRMEGWGIAGNGMYWRPVLECQVTPDGEGRFQELTALLRGSGLEIRRR